MTSKDPLALFQEWLAEAEALEPNDPNAMALATATKEGKPSLRVVLCKEANEKGFRFHTNAESQKGQDIAENGYACANFHWKSTQKQIRITGSVVMIPEDEVDAYFQTRHRNSQIGAWASQQTRKMESADMLSKRIKEFEKKFKDTDSIPRPEHWVGYRILPEQIEFWSQGDHRLHDRFVYIKDNKNWKKERLYP